MSNFFSIDRLTDLRALELLTVYAAFELTLAPYHPPLLRSGDIGITRFGGFPPFLLRRFFLLGVRRSMPLSAWRTEVDEGIRKPPRVWGGSLLSGVARSCVLCR